MQLKPDTRLYRILLENNNNNTIAFVVFTAACERRHTKTSHGSRRTASVFCTNALSSDDLETHNISRIVVGCY